jgi:hypothetical protein
MVKHDGKCRLLVGKVEAGDRDGEAGDLPKICVACPSSDAGDYMTQMLPASTNDGL